MSCRWCKEATDQLVASVTRHWQSLDTAQAEKRRVMDTAAMRAFARNRRVIAATTSAASKQR